MFSRFNDKFRGQTDFNLKKYIEIVSVKYSGVTSSLTERLKFQIQPNNVFYVIKNENCVQNM